MKNLVKSIRKLSPKKGDILVVQTMFDVDDAGRKAIAEVIREVCPSKKVPILFLHNWDKDNYINFEGMHEGKHKVYMNNLEYLEWLHNKRSK